MKKFIMVCVVIVCSSQIAICESWNITGTHGIRTEEFSGVGCGNSLVAIVDTGVDYNNPQLNDSVWYNPNEIFDGFDNDGNGYTDDIHGVNIGGYFESSSPLPLDIHGHGTHVAGIMFAKDFGIIPECKFIAINVFNSLGGASSLNAASAIRYLIGVRNKQGLDHIFVNLSFGGPESSDYLYETIQTGLDNGLIFIGASGNEYTSTDKVKFYPANYDGVVSVSSIGENGKMQDYANRGNNISIAAPGDLIKSLWLNQGTRTLTGTSMAAPHVTAMLAKFYGLTGEVGTSKLVEYSKYNRTLRGKTVKSSTANFLAMVNKIPVLECKPKKLSKCSSKCNKYSRKDICIRNCKLKYNC